MEGKSQVGPISSSSSTPPPPPTTTTTTKANSFASELFGSKESFSSSSNGIFNSIFSPSAKVIGRDSLHSEVAVRKQDSPSKAWNGSRHDAPDGSFEGNEGGNENAPIKDINPIFSEQRAHPCHLSSSIFYGGQDIYHPQSTDIPSTDDTFKKDGIEDDSGTASRGNWWQGSLYY